jgi:hypothetical protein
VVGRVQLIVVAEENLIKQSPFASLSAVTPVATSIFWLQILGFVPVAVTTTALAGVALTTVIMLRARANIDNFAPSLLFTWRF